MRTRKRRWQVVIFQKGWSRGYVVRSVEAHTAVQRALLEYDVPVKQVTIQVKLLGPVEATEGGQD